MKKVLVTGGAGFLGSHVADALSDKGYDVTIYDHQPSVYLRDDQKMIVGDILDRSKLLKISKGMDAVFHFAGQADIEKSSQDPYATIESNILGTTNALEACRQNGVGRFVFASTVYVYSHLGSFYRSSKQACEKIIQNYEEEFGVSFAVLRFGSLYGPRANRFNAIQNYLEQALTTGEITREGDGEELRDYVHVEDAALGAVASLDDAYRNSFVMITGNESRRVKDILTMIREMMQNKVEVKYIESSSDSHYEITPYSFRPEKAKKIVLQQYHDLGQGILDLLYQTYEEISAKGSECRIQLRKGESL